MPSITSTTSSSADSTTTLTTTPTIPLAKYIFTRLHQLGCRSIHGVPGDYNLTALDYVSDPFTPNTSPQNTSSSSAGSPAPLKWVSNCNELNAGYAADGYSRLTGLGAVITAFGVGELSALNAIAGAYAERAAVVHIVGTPPRAAQREGLCLHHTLGDGGYGVFGGMYRGVTVGWVDLAGVEFEGEGGGRVGEEVDRVLGACLRESRPVYVALPTDMVNLPVEAQRLERAVEVYPGVDWEEVRKVEDKVIARLVQRIAKARQPFVIVDGFCARYNVWEEVEALVRLLAWPTSSTPFGKSCIDETLPNFHGIYAGLAGRNPGVYKPWVESCDFVLRFGGLDSDVNTYGFSTLPPKQATVSFQKDHVRFGDDGVVEKGIEIKRLLGRLLGRLNDLTTNTGFVIPRMDPYPSHLGDPRQELADMPPADPKAPIEQHDFWRRMSHFFREGDVIMTETGTPSVGSREFVLPRNARLINSSIWLSIGYMLAAAQGAALAVREIKSEACPQKTVQNGDVSSTTNTVYKPTPVLNANTISGRTILFEGDGSFQMSAQELSTIIRHKLDLTLFLINNDGYVIERFIHGMRAHYNDVARWRYLDAPRFFGADMPELKAEQSKGQMNGHVEDRNGMVNGDHAQGWYRVQTHQARTWGELLDILARPEVQSGKGLCMIEVFMDREDAPESLKKLVRSVKKRNSPEGELDEVQERKKQIKIVEEKIVKAAG